MNSSTDIIRSLDGTALAQEIDSQRSNSLLSNQSGFQQQKPSHFYDGIAPPSMSRRLHDSSMSTHDSYAWIHKQRAKKKK